MAISNYCNILVPFRSNAPLWTMKKPNISPVAITCHLPTSCAATAKVIGDEKVVVRRSANYGAPIYDFQSIQSLNNGYSEEKYLRRANELKERVKSMLGEDLQRLERLEIVNDLEMLGLAYHFQPQLHAILSALYDRPECDFKQDLYAVALEFRVLRKHGYQVSPDVFKQFMNEEGEFDDNLSNDTKGMLSLYEASFLSQEGETILDMARDFTTKHLKSKLNNSSVLHALERPQWWRVPRTEAIWYIKAYETCPNMNPLLLQYAQLDFNILQATHQQELRSLSRWFKNTRAMVHLTFTRDRIVECFYAAAVMFPAPKYSSCRRMIGKIIAIINMVDDIYDVYGTLEELELFTDAVERWDVKAMDQLPNYMRVGYLLLFNTVNEMAYNVLKEQGIHIAEYLKKVYWSNACKVYMQEARWYYSGYTPRVEEYLENGLVSVGTPILLMHEYVETTDPLNMEALASFDSANLHPIVRCASVLMRLVDDLGTSKDEMKRGDVPKVLQCYMKETGCSEKEAREYAWNLYMETWKSLNKASMHEDADLPFPSAFVSSVRELVNVTHATYQHGDSLALYQDPETSRNVHATFFRPIPVSSS